MRIDERYKHLIRHHGQKMKKLEPLIPAIRALREKDAQTLLRVRRRLNAFSGSIEGSTHQYLVSAAIQLVKVAGELHKTEGWLDEKCYHTVTDHALCNYYRRVQNVNLKKLKDQALEDINRRGWKDLIIKDGRIVTVLPRGTHARK